MQIETAKCLIEKVFKPMEQKEVGVQTKTMEEICNEYIDIIEE